MRDTDNFSITAPSTGKRSPGRPPGTNYRWMDASLHDEMEALILQRAVPSLGAAAREVMPRAWGFGKVDDVWLERRLKEGFRAYRST